MKIHLIGIAGSAMGNLACMLKDIGHAISGSDKNVYPPMSVNLQEKKIKIYDSFDAKNIQSPDIVIVGNAISRGNVELETVLNLGLDYISMPQALFRFFLKNKIIISITGSHGKSTTTAMIAWMLKQCGEDPSWFLGGVGQSDLKSYCLGTGRYFVIEGDEYDSAYFDKAAKFFHYKPKYLIITSLEFDHADIYKNVAEIKTGFRRLCNMIPGNGLIISNIDYKHLRQVVSPDGYFHTRFVYYGKVNSHAKFFKNKSKLVLNTEQQFTENKNRKAFYIRELEPAYFSLPYVGMIRTKVFGEFNALNMCAAALLGKELGLASEKMKNSMETFPGVLRRQTIIVRKPFVLIDDFAHHPTAVRLTIKAVKQAFRNHKIWCLFEPRSATSHLNVFQNKWPRAFTQSDRLFITEVHNPKKFPKAQLLNVRKIVKDTSAKAAYFDDSNKLFITLTQLLKKRFEKSQALPLILVMSNGNFGGMVDKIRNWAKELQKN